MQVVHFHEMLRIGYRFYDFAIALYNEDVVSFYKEGEEEEEAEERSQKTNVLS